MNATRPHYFGACLAMVVLACACGEEPAPYHVFAPDASRPDPGSRDAQVDDDGNPNGRSDSSTALSEAWVPPTEPVTLDEFLDAHFDKVCSWVKRCQGLDTCDGDPSRIQEPRHMRDVIPPEVAAGRLIYDPEEGLRCLQAKLSCTSSTAFDLLCGPVFRGGVELGGECYDPAGQSECAEGVCQGTCPGRCRLPDVLHEDGEPCGENSCKEGSVCGVRDFEGPVTCGPERAEGESCDESTVCSNGLHCSNGRCAEHIARGAKCDFDHQCGSTDLCRDHDGERICQTAIPLGGRCAGETVCEDGSTCVEQGGGPLTCIRRAGLGKSCAWAACSYGLRCDNERKVCVTAGNLGDECMTICDFPLRCVDGACRMGADVDESCGSSTDCRADLYCDSGGVCREPGGAWAACDPDIEDSCDPLQVACSTNPAADAGTEYLCWPRCDGPDSVPPSR